MGNDYQAVKERTDIVHEIEKRTGFTTKKVGRDMDLEACPFCGGHSCFRITPEEKLFNCFQCDAGGDTIDFVARHDKLTRYEALIKLAGEIGYELQTDTGAGDPNRTPKNKIFELAAAYYHKGLLNNQSALNYQRKVRRHADLTLKRFKVGYTDGNLTRYLMGKGFSEDQLIQSGIAKKRKDKVQDFFIKGLYIYPHMDLSGNVVHFSTKDPKKKFNYQLSNDYRLPGAPFFNMAAFKSDVAVVTEGENDLFTLYGQGGCANVAACCGQISAEQIDYLREWIRKDRVKTLYLCFDNDAAGQRYRNRVESDLLDYCLPDKLLAIHHQLQKKVQDKLKEKFSDDDMEPDPASIPPVVQGRLKIIQFNPKCGDIDDFLKSEKTPKKAIENLMESAQRILIPLKKALSLQKSWYQSANIKPGANQTGELVFDYFRSQGSFFVDGEKCCLYFNDKFYEIGSSIAFKSMLYQTGGLNFAVSTTKNILEVLQAEAYEHGRHTSTPGWIHSEIARQNVFFNLCNDRNELIRIGPDSIDMVPNGTNTDRVLLSPSPKMEPLNYMADVDIAQAMNLFQTHVLENLPCRNSDKLFIACIIFNTLLIQFTKARGITKFSGSHASAKSSAAGFVSTLVYGKSEVTVGSAASLFSESTKSPLVIEDNLESNNLDKQKLEFLLLAATGITKQKRQQNSDSGNVYERVCTQVITTGIEPFTQDELISRTTDIVFDREFFNPDFVESIEAEAMITQSRDMIWSAFFNILAADILPGFKEKRLRALKHIKSYYPGHSKERVNELYSCLYLICKELLKYLQIPYDNPESDGCFRSAKEVLGCWINTQNRLEQVTTKETNPLLYHLNILLKDCMKRTPEGFSETYSLEGIKLISYPGGDPTGIKLIASSGDLFSAFNIIAKNYGGKNPYKSVRQLSSRIKDAEKILMNNGWEHNPREKKVRGDVKRSFTIYFDDAA